MSAPVHWPTLMHGDMLDLAHTLDSGAVEDVDATAAALANACRQISLLQQQAAELRLRITKLESAGEQP